MSLLQKTEDKIERFSLEVANQEMEKLRSRMDQLRIDLDEKVDVDRMNYYYNLAKHIDHKLDAFGEKYDHDRECIGNALQHISHILLGLAGDGVKIDKNLLMGLQTEILELQTRKEYWYDRYSNHAGYWN